MYNDYIDFLNFKTIFFYLIYLALIFLSGIIAKDICVLLVLSFIFLSLLLRNLFKAIEVWIIWASLYNFFVGQGLLQYQLIEKYISKPSFLLFIIFITFFTHIHKSVKNSKFFFIWIILIIVTLIGYLYRQQTPFPIITLSSAFMGYSICRNYHFSKVQFYKLFNLFVAISLTQLIVSILQLVNIIPPTKYLQRDGMGNQFLWEAGLDDLARGTFFVNASLFVCFVSILLLFIWVITKKRRYFYIAILSLVQISLADNKLFLGVMVVMLFWFFLYVMKELKKLRITFRRIMSIVLIMLTIIFSVFKLMDVYYKYQSVRGGAVNRTDFIAVFFNAKGSVFETVKYAFEDIKYWGKIKGYSYVIQDLANAGFIELISGFGLNNDRMFYIESKDIQFIQQNNFLNSRSGLIYMLNQIGLCGFILLIISIIFWYQFNLINRNSNSSEVVFTGLLNIIIPIVILTSFLRLLFFYSLEVVLFFVLIALLNEFSIMQNNTE